MVMSVPKSELPAVDTPPKLPEPEDNPNAAGIFGTNGESGVPPVAPAPEQTTSLLDKAELPAKFIGKGVVSTAVTRGLQTVLPKVAPQIVKAAPQVAQGMLRRAAGNVAGVLLPGAGLVAGTGAVPVLAGMTLYNGAMDTLDAGGLLPEFAGGDGLGNFGWDQQAFDQATTEGSALSRYYNAVSSPVKSVWTMGQILNEMGTEAAQKAYDSVRGR